MSKFGFEHSKDLSEKRAVKADIHNFDLILLKVVPQKKKKNVKKAC